MNTPSLECSLFPKRRIGEYDLQNKSVCHRPFKIGQSVRVCTDKMIDHQCREKATRNMYSNYYQMKAYCQSNSNEAKKYM